MVTKATAVFVIAVLSLVTACRPAARTATPIPEPTGTPVEVLATKPEDLAGIWFDGAWYHQFEADGTIKTVESIDEFDDPNYRLLGVFWFEDGTYYEQNAFCVGIYAYDVYLQIVEGRAVRLRMTLIEEGDPPCVNARLDSQLNLVRVD
jgi:hypothetical protein